MSRNRVGIIAASAQRDLQIVRTDLASLVPDTSGTAFAKTALVLAALTSEICVAGGSVRLLTVTVASPNLSIKAASVESIPRRGHSWPFALELWQPLKFWVLSGYTKTLVSGVLGFDGPYG
jgi:hypothetical protein